MAIVGDWKAQVIGQPGDWAGNNPALPAFIADSQPNSRNTFSLSMHLTEESFWGSTKKKIAQTEILPIHAIFSLFRI